jgi:hypothetical protein
MMANDYSLYLRIKACMAQQTLALPNRPAMIEYRSDACWYLCASPGWAAAYESAIARGLDKDEQGRPIEVGVRGDVITDGNILAAVQLYLQGLADQQQALADQVSQLQGELVALRDEQQRMGAAPGALQPETSA